MQVSKEEINTTRRVGVQEDLIKFRPSPNFINMKKFLKNRSDKSRSDYNEPPSTPQRSSPIAEVVQAASTPPKVQPEIKPVFQPPLPTYPPPPDSPPNIIIKTEKEDDDVQNTLEECERDNPEQINSSELEKENKNGPKKTMCKEWVRGNCKRAVCRFSHELDISQLRGVYTFCWNYQNDQCTYPYCKYVHASVFEEYEFYRTGVLPPHAKSHLKKPTAPPPPPPKETQGNIPQNFVTSPVLQPGIEKMPIITCVPPSVLEQRPDGYNNNVPRSKSPLKREWNEIEEFSSSPRDLETNDHLAKKCKNCGILEFRLQYNKEKVENIIQETEEITKKINNLNKKSNKLTLVLQTIFNSMNKGNTCSGGDGKSINLTESNKFLNSIKSSSVIEDSAKGIYGANISNLMAKILCVASDQTLSPDSRET